jgi:short-subunit dehydrogenase
MDPRYVAGAILSGIARRKQRIILPSQANLLILINFLSPSLADRLAREFHLQGWSMEEPDRQ